MHISEAPLLLNCICCKWRCYHNNPTLALLFYGAAQSCCVRCPGGGSSGKLPETMGSRRSFGRCAWRCSCCTAFTSPTGLPHTAPLYEVTDSLLFTCTVKAVSGSRGSLKAKARGWLSSRDRLCRGGYLVRSAEHCICTGVFAQYEYLLHMRIMIHAMIISKAVWGLAQTHQTRLCSHATS